MDRCRDSREVLRDFSRALSALSVGGFEEYVGRKNHPPNPKGRAGERRPRRKDVDSGIGG